jgi:signal transduction histidine kinase
MVLFPFEQGAFPLDDRQPVRQWLRIMEGAQEGGGLGRKVWRKHPEAMEAALKLTRTTGLLVTDDEEFSLGACHGVL